MSRGLKPAAVLAVAVPLASCSVMQIDVDVYKGPLANHKDVQTEQVAVMAISAEPLLIRLERTLCRQSLDDKYLKGDPTKIRGFDEDYEQNEQNAIKALKQCNYDKEDTEGVVKFIRSHCNDTTSCQTLEVAIGARRLYEDLGDLDPIRARWVVLSRKLRDNVDRLEINLAILAPSAPGNPTENQVRLAAWLRGISRNEEPFAELAQAYAKFLDPRVAGRFRLTSDLEDRLFEIPVPVGIEPDGADLARIERAQSVIRQKVGPLQGKESNSDPSDNTRFSILSDLEFLEAQSALLFPDSAERRASFEHEVARIATSFLSGRQAVEAILTDILEGTKNIGPLISQDDATDKTALKSMARLAATIINTRHLTAALTETQNVEAVAQLSNRLNNDLAIANVPSNEISPYKFHSTTAQRQVRKAIEKLLVEYPDSTATALLVAQTAFKEPGFEVPKTSVFGSPIGNQLQETQKRYDNTPDRRHYGLTRFVLSGAEWSELDQLIGSTQDAVQASEGILEAFDRGRLPEGLYTLVRQFLETSEDDKIRPCEALRYCDQGETRGQANRRLLHDAMVRFAHRVLFAVNNEALFSDISDSTKTYVQVLQTVGNSILVHVDAMRQEAAHEKKLVDAKDREISAIRQVYGASPSEAFARLMSALQDRVASVTAEVSALQASQRPQTAAVQAAEAAVAKAQVDYMTSLPEALRQLAHTWFALGYDPKTLGYKLTQAQDDNTRKGQIDALISGTPPALAGLYAAIEIRLKTDHAAAVNQASGSSPQLKKLADAVAQLTDANFKALFSSPSGTKVDLVNQLKAELQQKHATEKQALFGDAAMLAAVRAAENTWNDAIAKHTAEMAKLAGLPQQITAAQAKVPPLTAAKVAFNEKRRNVILAVERSGTDRYGQAVYDELSVSLQSAWAAAPANSAERKKFGHAIGVLADLSPPVDVPTAQAGKLDNAKDVLDGLIAALRHRHLQALAENDPRGAQITRSAEALAEGYRQRGDMIFLRPAMSYLRTSFTASTLQDNYLAWRNMLTEHGIRSGIPLIPQDYAKQKAKTITEIDKQFWQNINRVRVAGAGDTNYAITKDDVGNWYVKSYSTDPSDIIQSARNLALFSLGPELGTDVLGRTLKRDKGEDPGLGGVQLSQLQLVYLKFQDRYNTETTTAYQGLITDLGDKAVAGQIDTKWKANLCYEASDDCGEALKALLEAFKGNADALAVAKTEMEKAVKEVEDNTKADGKDDKRNRKESKVARVKGTQIIVGLQATRRFHDRLATKVRQADLTKRARDNLETKRKENEAQKEKVAALELQLQSDKDALTTALREHPSTVDEPEPRAVADAESKVQATETALAKERANATEKEAEFRAAESKLSDIRKAEASALTDARDVIEQYVKAKTAGRIAVVDDFDRALIFLGDAISEEEPSPAPQTPDTPPTGTQTEDRQETTR